MPYHFTLAPSGFKESLSARQAAESMAEGIRRVTPEATLDLIPLVDGGEGTAEALALATGGRLLPHAATGPVGDPVRTHFALLGPAGGPSPGPTLPTSLPTAVVEMAAVAGLSLVPPNRRDPGTTTTYGVGELIGAALDAGARRVLVGCGDSGTSDGGAGALQALGARLLDAAGAELPRGGHALALLDRIDPSGLDPRLRDTELLVACNPFNVLCGPSGVARVYGPQKGATPAQVESLAEGLDRWADVLERDVRGRPAQREAEPRTDLRTDSPPEPRTDLRTAPGTGASGGLGAGLAALGARLLPRFEVLLDRLDLDARLARADLVLTAEGSLDSQTARGKVPAEVARRAKAFGKPVLALAGTLGEGAHETRATGIDAYGSILPAPLGLAEALTHAPAYLADATEHALRMVLLGTRLQPRPPHPPRPPQPFAGLLSNRAATAAEEPVPEGIGWSWAGTSR
ncbi:MULTISPECIES: glycerate kinase [unclassified Streptomyces]|uniref:glycerate kinase family protein n=1 Tax=unclassified Streptomyces TaxID=2593676 RepID=UPI002DD9C221|nr:MULTISPECIES: glycerate kinase [unclassified Streptomyces]WSA95274.1 glycerate kinase [Streptomyces sp. NBC_01795]WSB79692.1 glycerate kinase [Streptomyces sp. NBC_01775]WSS12103.1 glycerate kinase [Streptomyces sp. NBC_01186]WSS40816.1 glycerate kinase [Streptomyces sp. NBC_01187]